MTAAITIQNDRLALHFRTFDLENYKVFLKAKRLPEYQVQFVEADESYIITAPARFAPVLGVQLPTAGAQALPLAEHLFDDQDAIVRMALDAKRFACWSDCGNGKTPIILEWSRQIIHRTGGRVLGITMNEIVQQTIDEARKFYGDALPIVRLHTRQEMREWCKSGPGNLAITNYEKMNPEDLDHQVVTEMRHLAGIWLDESHRLRTGGGKQKWAIIKSCRGIEFKLSSTATPAPNDVMEFASQAAFLEKMRDEGEILWTFFTRDQKTHRWTVKPHARKAFFEFMAGWSIYVRDPRKYGWRKGMKEVPPPIIQQHEIKATDEQREAARRFSLGSDGQPLLWQTEDTNAIQRAKLSQIAKGFVYLKGQNGRFERIASRKPKFVADLIRKEVKACAQVLVWTVFDAESTILAEELGGKVPFELLTGKTRDEDRMRILESFRKGQLPVLVSRASMLGHGLNFHFVDSMIFSGWSDSYVLWYQALRRAYRYGQTKRLRVHVPVIPELEQDQLDNIFRKQVEHERSIEEQEQNYVRARRALMVGEVA
jgi:hypothetical protein